MRLEQYIGRGVLLGLALCAVYWGSPLATFVPDVPPGQGPGQGSLSSRTTWRLIYFEAPTRGEQLRLLFRAAKTPYEDVRLVFPKGLRPYKHAALGDDSPLLFDQCPAVTSPSGEHIAQTAACMQYVGRSLGFVPKSEALDARAMALTLFSEELRNTVFYKLLIPMILDQYLRRKCCGIFCMLRWPVCLFFRVRKTCQKLAPQLQYLESALRKSGKRYFCGDTIVYADIAIFDCLREIFYMPVINRDAELKTCPLLADFLGRMEELPEWKGYLQERGPALEFILRSLGVPDSKRNSNENAK